MLELLVYDDNLSIGDHVVEKFSNVFDQPHSLSPFRGKDHAIVLQEGASPVNVRP